MPPTTPVRGTATSASDAPVAPRRGRPPKPTEKIREAQATLGLGTTSTRAATHRAILPAITVAPTSAQQIRDAPRIDTTAGDDTANPPQSIDIQSILVEEIKGYRAVIQTLSSELKEAQKDRQTQIAIIHELRTIAVDAHEEARKGRDDARKGWEELRKAREETKLIREEVQLSRNETQQAKEVAEALRTELATVKEEVGESLQKLASEVATLSSRPPSWASVVARGNSSATSPAAISHNDSQDTNQSVSPFSSVSQEKAAGLMGIGLELGPMQRPTFDIRSIASVKLRLRQAFDAHPATSAVPITGLSKKGETGTSYRIRVGDEKNVKKVKECREWLASHFEGARMKEDNEYLVVVDGVDKETICDESKTEIRPTAHEEIGKENNISISKIRFLGRGNPGRNRCSVILHMQDKREADHLTSRQYMEFGDEMVFTRKYTPRAGPQRCFKCQRFGNHRARDCPSQEATCERCGLDGHEADTCASNTTKCVNCSGSHMASDRRCPAFARTIQGAGQPSNV
jgi:hypothetical protein